MISILIKLFAAILLIAGLALLRQLIEDIREQRASKEQNTSRSGHYYQSPEYQEPQCPNDSLASSSKETQLVRLLNGDYRAAARLVEQVSLRNPDRSCDWCLEKVIFDLERDRR